MYWYVPGFKPTVVCSVFFSEMITEVWPQERTQRGKQFITLQVPETGGTAPHAGPSGDTSGWQRAGRSKGKAGAATFTVVFSGKFRQAG